MTSGGATTTYNYDADGQLKKKVSGGTTSTFTWDAQQNLASDTVGGNTSTYTTGPDGARWVRQSPTETVLYLAGQEVHLPAGSSTTSAVRYYSMDGANVAVRKSGTGAGVSWMLTDQQGSDTIAVSSAAGTLSRDRYLPYGGNRSTSFTLPTDHGWLGQVQDKDTGLDYLNARYYDPVLAHFLSTDPADDQDSAQAANAYAYAADNPATFSDPTGLFSIGIPKIIKNVASKAKSVVSGGYNSLKSVVSKVLKPLVKAAVSAAKHVVKAVKVVAKKISAGVKKVAAAVKTVRKAVVNTGKKAASAVHKAASSTGRAVRKAAGATGKAAGKAAAKAGTVAKSKGVQIGLGAGIAALTVINIAQLGLDPLTDAAEVGAVAEEASIIGGEALAEGSAEAGLASESNLATVTKHLDSIDALASHPPNAAMVARIQEGIENGRTLTAGEQNFMTHELTEANLVSKGMQQDAAHELAGQTHPTFANYDPEVIKQYPDYFNSNWRKYWGIP